MSRNIRKARLATYRQTDPDEFIGLLVHDVRGPLSGIISATRLMQTLLDEDEPPTADQFRELSDIIIKATEDMRAVLDPAIDYDKSQRKS